MRTFIQCILRLLEAFFGLLVLMVVFHLYFSLIPIHFAPEDEPQKHFIVLRSNGEHTDIIIEKSIFLKCGNRRFLRQLTFCDTSAKQLAIGWGELNFFLKTKNWSDLTAGTLFKAMFHLGQPALHIVECNESNYNDRCIRVACTKKQLNQLIDGIQASFALKQQKITELKTPLYDCKHHFYLSTGSYGLSYTCNTWTNSQLANAHFDASLWTLFPNGIMRWYKN